jgi:cell division protein FtsW (lipid II flippase)
MLIKHQRILQRYTYVAGLLAVILISLPMVPGLGISINGARVWIQLGTLTFQPGEIAKIALAVFFAGYLVQRRESLSMVGRTFLGMRFPRGRDLGPIIVVWALSMAVIVFQRDLGTGLLFFGLFLVMLYVATGRGSWVALGLSLIGLGAVVANQTLDYVNGRFANWYDAFNQENFSAPGGSYQLVQGLFGLAHGGVIGTGLGEGMPEVTPVSQSDYIIASLGEELGLAGIFAILCLYLLLVGRGLRIGFAGHDDFSKLLAVGLSFTIALQCFIVIGGVMRVIPLTGLTTPFLAAGGSSLVANWIIAALLLRLSDSIRSEPRLVVG